MLQSPVIKPSGQNAVCPTNKATSFIPPRVPIIEFSTMLVQIKSNPLTGSTLHLDRVNHQAILPFKGLKYVYSFA